MSSDSRTSRERCAPWREHISLLVDGEANLRMRLVLRAHLGRCRDCRAFLAELRALAAALRSTALAPVASLPRRRLGAQPQRLALAGGLGVLGVAVTMSGLLRGTAVTEVGALSPAQGFPVYSTPYLLEGLPVYTPPEAVLQALSA